MRLSEYQELHKDKIEFTIQERFADSMRQLYELGFTEEFYIREAWFPLSALVMSPLMLILYSTGEIVRVGGALRVMAFNPFIIHEEGFAYAEVMKIGVNYITLFDDGTILRTPTFHADQTSRREDRYIIQNANNPALTFHTAWRQHVWKVKKLMGYGQTTIAPLTVKDIMSYEAQIDRLALGFQRLTMRTDRAKWKSSNL